MAEAGPQEQPQEPQTGSSNAALAMELSRKPYYPAVEDVIQHTAACRADFDQKTMQMLDVLHSLGRVEAACRRLKDVIGIMPRSHVVHWRGYLFKLLRDFDDEAYHIVKGKMAASYALHLPWIEEPTDHQHMRPAAPNFVPGSLGWLGEVGPDDFAKVASHPLHATAPAFDPGMPAWGWEPAPSVELQEMFVSGFTPATPSFTSVSDPVERKVESGAASLHECKKGSAAGSSTDGQPLLATSAKKESKDTALSQDVITEATGSAECKREGVHVRSVDVSPSEHERETGDVGSTEVDIAAAMNDTDRQGEGSSAAPLEHGGAAACEVTDPFEREEVRVQTPMSESVHVSESGGTAKCINLECPAEGQPPMHGEEGDAVPTVTRKPGGDFTTSAKHCEAEPSGPTRRACQRPMVVSSRGSAGRNSTSRGGRGFAVWRGRGRGSQVAPRPAAPIKPAGGIGSAALGKVQARVGVARPPSKTGSAVVKGLLAGKSEGKVLGEVAAKPRKVQEKAQEEAGEVKSPGTGRTGVRTRGRGGALSRVTGSTRSADKAGASSGSATKTTVGGRVWVAGPTGRQRRWHPAAPWKR